MTTSAVDWGEQKQATNETTMFYLPPGTAITVQGHPCTITQRAEVRTTPEHFNAMTQATLTDPTTGSER